MGNASSSRSVVADHFLMTNSLRNFVELTEREGLLHLQQFIFSLGPCQCACPFLYTYQ